MFKSRIRYRIHIFDPSLALLKIKSEDIKIFHFHKIEDYVYEFESYPHDEKKIKKIFSNAILIKRIGPYSWFYNLFTRKTTLIAIIVASICFYSLSTRVYTITINGDSRTISSRLSSQIEALGIIKYCLKPREDELQNYEKQLKKIFYDDIEFLEIRLKGVNLIVNYKKRRTGIELPTKTSAKYATKRGIIDHFVISSGEVVVKENQYVEEGTLLINDYILSSRGEEINVGAEGEVYAWTWTIVTLSKKINNHEEESEIMQELIDEASFMIAKGFYKEERIDKINILLWEIVNNEAYMKAHFTCLEDIAN